MFGIWVLDKRNKRGFTFLELIIALTIIEILVAIAVPNFKARQPGYERKQFVAHLNALMQVALQNAIVMHRLHKVTFDIEKRTISVDYETDTVAATGDVKFVSMSSKYLNSKYVWPEDNFVFKNFYVATRDELSIVLGGSNKGKVWFFITPEGLAQPVIINMIDLKDTRGSPRGREFSLVLNPFSAQFKENDTFSKP